MVGGEFRAVIESGSDGRGAAVRLPFDPKTVFGRPRAPVQVTIGRGEPFRARIAVYGAFGWVGLRKAQLVALNVRVGEMITVSVELDELPRGVEVPPELAVTLESYPDAQAIFRALSMTHRTEYTRWVAEAKLAQTRHAARVIDMLRKGAPTPN